nr:PsbP-related protein [uncultured Methanobacterium sp.]
MVSSREKIGIIIVIILIISLIAYNFTKTGGIEQNTPVNTSFFSANGVSFEYPSSWRITTEKQDDDTFIVGLKDDSSLFKMPPFQLQITPNYGISEEGLKKQLENTVPSDGWSKVSNSTIIIDGKTAYLEVFNVKSIWPPVWDDKLEIITLANNNSTYTILLEAPQDQFNKEHFDILLNSFKIE